MFDIKLPFETLVPWQTRKIALLLSISEEDVKGIFDFEKSVCWEDYGTNPTEYTIEDGCMFMNFHDFSSDVGKLQISGPPALITLCNIHGKSIETVKGVHISNKVFEALNEDIRKDIYRICIRIKDNVQRYKDIVALDAPDFIVGNDVRLLCRKINILESGDEPDDGVEKIYGLQDAGYSLIGGRGAISQLLSELKD
jgi:hypothetical protein